MDNTNNKKEKLLFPDNILQLLSDVLKAYKLEETSEQVLEKIKNNQLLSGEIVMDAVRDLLFGKMQEKDLPALLQKNLNISQINAENLSNDVTTKITPLIKKVPDEEPEEVKTPAVKQEEPLSFVRAKPTLSVEENEEKIKTPTKKTKTPLSERIKEPVPKSRQSRGPDRYREPVE